MSVLSRLMLTAARSSWPSGVGQSTAEEVLTGIVAWAALGVCLWLVAAFLLATLSVLPGAVGRWAARAGRAITPALMRRALSLLLGASVGTLGLPTDAALGDAEPPRPTHLHVVDPVGPGPAFSPTGLLTPVSPAFRAVDPSETEATAVAVSRADVTGSAGVARAPDPASTGSPHPGWRPSRPTTVHDAEASQLLAPVPRTATAPIETVTVRRGDSLWSIASRQLGPGASDAEIAVAWPVWHALNADLIGDDPNLIHPGLRLRVPTDGDQP
jgi:nucleoid-associated protein YgaU